MSHSNKYSGKGKGSPRQAGQQVQSHQAQGGRIMGDAKTGAGMTTQAGAGARQAPLSDKDAGSDVWDKGNAPTGKGIQGKR